MLGHLDAVALDAGCELADGAEVLNDAGFRVSEAAIERQKVGPHAEYSNVDGLAAFCAQILFGGLNHQAAETPALLRGIDGELAEIAARAEDLDGYAGKNAAGAVFGDLFLRDQDFAFLHRGGQALVVGARAFEEGLN